VHDLGLFMFMLLKHTLFVLSLLLKKLFVLILFKNVILFLRLILYTRQLIIRCHDGLDVEFFYLFLFIVVHWRRLLV